MAEEEGKALPWPKGAEKVENPSQVKFMMVGNDDKPIMKIELDRLNELVEVNGESMPAIQGGATAATAVALPAGPTGQNRWFDASWGYWKYNNTVLKNPLGTDGIPQGNDGMLYWDGTALTWKISKMQVLPVDPDSIKKADINIAGGVTGFDRYSELELLTNKGDIILPVNDNSLFQKNGWNYQTGASVTSNNLIRLPYKPIPDEWIGHNLISLGYGLIPVDFARIIIMSPSGTVSYVSRGKVSADETFEPIIVPITSAMQGYNIAFTVATGTNIDPANNPYIASFKVYLDEVPSGTELKIKGNKVIGTSTVDVDGVPANSTIREEIKFVKSFRLPSKQLLDNSTFTANGWQNNGGNGTTNNLVKSPKIPVQQAWRGKNLTFSKYGAIPTGFNHVTAWKNDGTIEWSKAGLGVGMGTNPITFPITDDTKEIAFTIGQATGAGLDPTNSIWANTVMLNVGDEALAWDKYGGFIDPSFIKGSTPVPDPDPEPETDTLMLYLPTKLNIALGRTLELYHKQILWTGNFNAYHFYWTGVGRKLGRKLSIQPSAEDIGSHTATLNIMNKNNELVIQEQMEVNVVSNVIASLKNVLCIGDSLTNAKYWLRDIKNNLSSNIQFVGTRIDTTDPSYRHEGRSGMSALNYMQNYDYQGDNFGIDGNDGRTQNLNPFWNPSTQDVDFEYYLANYNVDRPDVIVLWLGTNGLSNGVNQVTGAANIKLFIDKLRATGADGIPILLCHTLIWSNQDGIAFQGSTDGFQSSSTYKLLVDAKIFDLSLKTRDLLKDYPDLHFVPLNTCHDSDYNYGAVEFPANPRISTKVYYPNQAVHPRQEGYLQCGDVIFSAICGVINS